MARPQITTSASRSVISAFLTAQFKERGALSRFAKKYRFSRQSLLDYRTGATTPSPETIERLANAIPGFPVGWFESKPDLTENRPKDQDADLDLPSTQMDESEQDPTEKIEGAVEGRASVLIERKPAGRSVTLHLEISVAS